MKILLCDSNRSGDINATHRSILTNDVVFHLTNDGVIKLHKDRGTFLMYRESVQNRHVGYVPTILGGVQRRFLILVIQEHIHGEFELTPHEKLAIGYAMIKHVYYPPHREHLNWIRDKWISEKLIEYEH